jgi:uncharacterized protein
MQPAAGETDLATLIRSMRPTLADGAYVFAALAAGEAMPAGADPLMAFREAEGLTLIVTRDKAEAMGLAAVFPCRLITLTIHSSLEAIGFLAAVTARLAEAGIPVNPVSAFHHDHLFVPEARAEETLQMLKEMARG